MEPSSALPGLSFRKVPREGQERVLEEVAARRRGSLSAQLPTGYGKTFVALAAYSMLRAMGEVDRLLYVVPTVAQLGQIVDDTETIRDAAVPEPWTITDFGFSDEMAIKRHRRNESHVFVCTIQSLLNSATRTNLLAMMGTSRWMVVVDEYHHYAVAARWGQIMSSLPCVFRLAMSATPYRPDEDGAFGAPDVVVTYREAAKQGAVKRLVCHSYVYQIDAVSSDGELKTYTAQSLIDEVGSAAPDKIEKYKLERQMRWSPKYVSPLVDAPIARIVRERIETGLPLQVLVGAMCCSHAKMVYEQVREMYPELRVAWVGTGESGRPDAENRAILKKFCPDKRADSGERDPDDVEVDVLVHVGMAGEGLDSTFVTEIVHLNPANMNNSNNQENGRAARVIRGIPPSHQVARINVDSNSDYAEYVGESVMDAMDERPPGDTGEPDGVPGGDGPGPLPEEPTIRIVDMRCIRIDEGEVARMKEAYVVAGARAGVWSMDILKDAGHPIHAEAESLYRNFRMREAESFNSRSVLMQWQGHVEAALRHVVGVVIGRMRVNGVRFDKGMPGDIKKRINTKKRALFGAKPDADVPDLKRQYQWLTEVEATVREKGIPEWLL